jgi:hypothetical protein
LPSPRIYPLEILEITQLDSITKTKTDTQNNLKIKQKPLAI